MKQLETDSRRGGSARQVHQKYITLPKGWPTVVGRIGSFSLYASSMLLMGLTQDRLGQEYRSGQLTRVGVKTKSK